MSRPQPPVDARRSTQHLASWARGLSTESGRSLQPLLVVAILALILPSCLAGAARKRAKPSRAEVRITLGASTVKVPSSFLGISTEY